MALYRFYFQIHPGSINGPQAIEFLRHLQRHVPGKRTVIWDGAPIHRSRLAQDFMASTGGRIVVERLPAYAPELHPVEHMWGNLKTHQIGNLIATQAWGLGMQATAAHSGSTPLPPDDRRLTHPGSAVASGALVMDHDLPGNTPPNSPGFLALKAFHPAPRGPWSHVPESDWADWRWQMKNRVASVEHLARFLPSLSPEERAGAILAGQSKLAVGITPHFFSLIDASDPQCPIRWQVVPRMEETSRAPWEMADPCGEDEHSPVPGLVHRYPDRVLFLVTDRCASYCRYCTRSRLVSNASGYDFHPNFDRQIEYIASNPSIRDVLLSGGDPLLLSDEKLAELLGRLRAIPHVEFLRIGSRIPIFLPQRITPALCGILHRFHPLFLSIHANHPRELTTEVRDALGRLADAGIPLGNQSVLLRHVNDTPEVMRALVHKLLQCRVRPYYLYQCDLIAGSAHLRASVEQGLHIIESLRGHTTGYAVPQYVIDAPGGGGKVPVNPDYTLARQPGRVLVRNFEGRVFEYPDGDAPRFSRPLKDPARPSFDRD